MSDARSQVTYASLLRRFQALVTDTLVMASLFVVAIFAPSVLDLPATGTRSVFLSLLLIALLYEPILVSRRGGTIGHYRYGLRVTDVSGQLLGFWRSLARAWIKGLLGWFSLLFMMVTERAQSLHDMACHSVVVLQDADAASDLDRARPVIPLQTEGMPGRARRILVIAAYSALAFVVSAVVATFTLSLKCLESNVCTPADDMVVVVVQIVWVAMTGLLVIHGWRGRLLGARRRSATPNQVVTS